MKIPKMPRTDEDAWTFLTADELDDFFALLESDLARDDQRAIFSVAVFAGLRKNELWGLQWGDLTLDGPRPQIHVRRQGRDKPTKSGKPRRVPCFPPAAAALERWRQVKPGVGSAFVWPSKGGGPHHKDYDAGWVRLHRLLAVARSVRFHDLRHTFASHLVMGTWGRAWRLEEVQQVLGHVSIETTQRYAHLAPDSILSLAAEHRLTEPRWPSKFAKAT